MLVEKNAPLHHCNTFGIAACADTLVRVRSVQDVHAFALSGHYQGRKVFVLGGGSNIVLAGDVIGSIVLKMEIPGIRVVAQTQQHWIVEAGAGVCWHDLVTWTLQRQMPGLENLALVPGTVGAAPVQNIGAYGVELQDRFHELDAVDLVTGQCFTLNAAQCAFGYRDSIFKHAPAPSTETGTAPIGMGLAGRAVIVAVRLALPKHWKPELSYLDLQRKQTEETLAQPSAHDIYRWVCAIRRDKLPDPAIIGNAGSFFKNPTVTAEQCHDIIAREPRIVHYPMPDGSIKLAAGWMIEACGWKGKCVGNAGVYDKQALVLVNRAACGDSVTGGEVMTLARAIQTSVYERFGIRLEPEPVVVG